MTKKTTPLGGGGEGGKKCLGGERDVQIEPILVPVLFQSKLKGSFIFGRFISKANINMLSYSMLDAL